MKEKKVKMLFIYNLYGSWIINTHILILSFEEKKKKELRETKKIK
jgi:hypothetical protein